MSELIYGRRAAHEAMLAGRRHIYRLWIEGAAPPKAGSTALQLVQTAEARQIPVRRVEGGVFERLASSRVNAQGVALEVDAYPYVALDECLARAEAAGEPPLLLLLDHLQDPQNLGTLMRTADAMGVHGVVIPERRAANITPAVSNASAGAVEHLAVAQVTNLNRVIDQLKRANIWVGGLDGAPDVPTLEQANLTGALALVIGSEGKGLSRLAREKCDFLIRLPMAGNVASLNAAAAGSIALYAARHARR